MRDKVKQSIYNKAYNETHPRKRKEYYKEYAKAWRKANPDKVRANRKRWIGKNYTKYKEITNRCKRAWDLKHQDKIREHRQNYRRKKGLHYYIITEEAYRVLYDAQGGKCAICGSFDERRLAVDHNHITGQIRGLLCFKCNIGLGWFKDDPVFLEKAVGYLTKDRAAKSFSPVEKEE